MKKYIKLFLTFSLCTFLAFGYFSNAFANNGENNNLPPANTGNDASSNINLLFVQTAQAGVVKAIPDKPGYFQLILFDVSPYTTYFSERPHRLRGIVPTDNFVRTWNVGNNSFAANNPNAAIIPSKIDGELNIALQMNLAILSSPIYHEDKNILTYILQPLFAPNFYFKEMKLDYVTLLISG